MRLIIPLLTAVFCLLAPLCADAAEAEKRPVDFVRDVKPIFVAHCGQCHGALRQKGELRLDAGTLALKGGENGEIIVPGKSSESLLLEYILPDGDDPPQMPPEGQGTPLEEKAVAIVRAWIDQGAAIPANEAIPGDPRKHWSYQRIERPAVPQVGGQKHSGNPVDAFILAKHAEQGLQMLAPTRKEILLRRVYLDLIGLPPTRAELHAFLADTSADAYEKVVDQLLESPRYGERWGRHWMDVWRYSDWAGYKAEVRESQPHIWRWRDWIIESLNADKPYDTMVQEMLAADEIAPGDPDTLRATGYLVRNWYKFNRNVWLETTIEHTAKAFLGVTLNCAKCHEHMYDPISQEEYYRFRAIFEPHQVRTDQVPGTLNVKNDGVVRTFDAKLDASTFLFQRGNEKHPVKEQPLTAAVPANLAPVGLEIKPVTLSPSEYYPGLKDHVQNETLNYARAALRKSEQALQAAAAKLNVKPATPPTEETDKEGQPAKPVEKTYPDADVAVAAKQVAYELLNLQSIRARIAADVARYALPPAANVAELSILAGRAERETLAAKNEVAVAQAELGLTKAKDSGKPDDDKTKKAVKKAQDALDKAAKALETARTAVEKADAKYSSLGKIYPTQSTGRRLALAHWITSRENPLAARVAVNHIWLRHFGEPLVPTVFDFGLNGKKPTHPKLLDWLATELIEDGWRMKRLHRLLVTSVTYRMASSASDTAASDTATNRQKDPDNIYLWKMPSRRMEGEIVRDSVLHVSGQLDLTAGGPEIAQSAGQTNFRRSVYFRTAKEKQMPFLELFDQASVNECYRRNESIVPQQALAMVNSPLALSQGRVLAQQLTKETGGKTTPEATALFLTAAFEQILSRPPTDEERNTCTEFLTQQTARLADPTKLTKFDSGPKVKVKPSPDPALRARENLVQVLFSHNDFFTIR